MMTAGEHSKGQQFEDGANSLYYAVIAERAVLVVVRGRMGPPLMQHTLAGLEALVKKKVGFINVFMDASEMLGIDAEARSMSEQWGKNQPANSMDCHVLIRSKLLDMAISLLRLAVRNAAVTSYSSAPAWEKRVAQAVPGFVRKAPAELFTAAR